jgi:hypothetical protein
MASVIPSNWTLPGHFLFYQRDSDTAAIGGDLMYHYAVNANLSNLPMAQALQMLADLQDPSPRWI